MTLSLSKKNVLSVMTMTLTMISLISPADAQTTCSSTSPDCCWVVQSWEKMGKKTKVDRNSATACCSGIPGVRCISSGKVTQIYWGGQGLQGSIPPEFGNLTNLRILELSNNRLSGFIPPELGNLTKLEWIYFGTNPGLTGIFTPRCGTKFMISNTNVIICGCLAASTPPTIFPPPETHADCLASGPALTLAKRTQAYGQVIGGYKYTCHVDYPNKNPFADCTNSMAFLCNTSDTTWNLDGAKRERCRTAVDQMYGNMSTIWQAVRRDCGQWSWNSSPAISTAASSANCATANSNLIAKAVYVGSVRVTSGFTNSQNDGLWSKVTA